MHNKLFSVFFPLPHPHPYMFHIIHRVSNGIYWLKVVAIFSKVDILSSTKHGTSVR